MQQYFNGTKEEVEKHLYVNGIRTSYVRWRFHGEEATNHANTENVVYEELEDGDDDLEEMIREIGQGYLMNEYVDESSRGRDADGIMRLLEETKKELYPGCTNYTQLSFIVTLLHLKTMHGWTINSFDALLGVLKKALPTETSIPPSYYEAKKVVRDMGFKYEKIHACVNDCVLYRNEYACYTRCPNKKCDQPRYIGENSKVPRKVLRYFPLKSRLRTLFMNKEVARDMRWHKEVRDSTNDNIMRHPADSEAWKHFDMVHEDFAKDPRNIRLGLASDGFNPFDMSNSYSIWPVFLVPYNLPPWKCMKDQFSIMSMLIPGPKSPGKDIDVYLQPLIDELNELWNGVEVYDAYKEETFILRASLLWTINDFPAYAMLSGWSTQGYSACPICMNDTTCIHLRNSSKRCYMGHRRFLPKSHRWRKMKHAFDGTSDMRDPVILKSGEDVQRELQLHAHEFPALGKGKKVIEEVQSKRKRQPKRKRQQKKNSTENMKWTKKSIFFELPYWKDLKLRHNIDIMHVVKNVAESLI